MLNHLFLPIKVIRNVQLLQSKRLGK